MSKRVTVLFDNSSMAERWGARLRAIDATSPTTSAYPFIYEDVCQDAIARARGETYFRVPHESHVRVYLSGRLLGYYCGHSQAIEPFEYGARVRYRGGYAEVWCPHSQEWEGLG